MKRSTIRSLGIRAAVAACLLGGLWVGGLPWVAAAPSSASSIQGQYAVTIIFTQVPKDLSEGPSATGRWRITFGANGQYTLDRLDVGTMVTGTYKVSGNTITITDKSGLLSCSASGIPQRATGVYTWKLSNGNLTLTPKSDDCGIRRVILSTSTLTTFVACLTKPLGAQATPVPAGTVSPNEKVAVPAAGSGAASAGTATNQVVDGLLKQLTACWATGDPSRVLPLFSQNLLSQLESEAGSLTQVVQILQPFTDLQLTWTRAGNVSSAGPGKANAVVKVSTDQSQDFLRFSFVIEQGQWRIDTFILGPNEIPGSQTGGGSATQTP